MFMLFMYYQISLSTIKLYLHVVRSFATFNILSLKDRWLLLRKQKPSLEANFNQKSIPLRILLRVKLHLVDRQSCRRQEMEKSQKRGDQGHSLNKHILMQIIKPGFIFMFIKLPEMVFATTIPESSLSAPCIIFPCNIFMG